MAVNRWLDAFGAPIEEPHAECVLQVGMIASIAGWTLGELTIVISAASTPDATINALKPPAIAAAAIFFNAIITYSMISSGSYGRRH